MSRHQRETLTGVFPLNVTQRRQLGKSTRPRHTLFGEEILQCDIFESPAIFVSDHFQRLPPERT